MNTMAENPTHIISGYMSSGTSTALMTIDRSRNAERTSFR